MDVQRYGIADGAEAYGRKYRSPLRALSSLKETRLVARALADAGVTGPVLDCPCGAGRLLPALRRRASRVVAADVSPAMVRRARDGAGFLVASAFALPFADRSFDAAVCHRLLHHLPDAADRARVLGELARVARRAVVVSFSDATTRKGRRKTRRALLTPDALGAEAAACGLALAAPPRRVNAWFSVVAVALLRPTRR